jgi:hypothetical protein
MLYIRAKAKLQIKLTINHTIANNIFKVEFAIPSLVSAIHPTAANVQNKRATTHNQTSNHIKNFQKKDQSETSLGALSNIATSGLSILFEP